MLILYNLSTHEVIGVSAFIINNNNKPVEPTLKGCFPDKKIIPNVSAIKVPNDERIANELYKYRIKFNRTGEPIGLELKPPRPYIELSTNFQDEYTNQVLELKADGRSKMTITAAVRDHTGNILTSEQRELVFKTTGGRLKKKIVDTENGVAKNSLQSVKETKTVTLTATARGCRSGSLTIDFV
jgi:hypothetical protein